MKAGLIDLGGRMPNLALMRISSWHKSQGDKVTLGAGGDVTYISCCFSRHHRKAEALVDLYPHSAIGGPGWDPAVTLPQEIATCRPDYSLYGIAYGIGRLTEGCPGACPWCVVPATEGALVKTVARIGDVANPLGDMVVLLDANILASPDWIDHFRDIREWGGWIDLTQGMDIRLVSDLAAFHIAQLKTISVTAWLTARSKSVRLRKGRVHFSWDRIDIEHHMREGIKLLSRYMSPDRLTFYMMVGYDTTWEQDWYRFQVLRVCPWALAPPIVPPPEPVGKKCSALSPTPASRPRPGSHRPATVGMPW